MAKKLEQNKTVIGGISDSLKSGDQSVFAFGAGVDFRSDPFQHTINPRNEKQAGSLIKDLPMWGDLACSNLYFYGNTGNIYLKDGSDNWTIDHLSPNSSGNGLAYFPEDRFLYYAQDKTIGRKSRACDADGEYYDGFLESEGGEPTNAQSITFTSASSQYASIADNASLSITDDISLETYVKFSTLPTSGAVQTLISKWNENGNQRSYKLDLTTTSSFFGDGRDGAYTPATGTDDPIDANGSGTIGSYTLTTRNEHASFSGLVSGDKVLIHQTRGDNAGTKQVATVLSFSGHTLTLAEALTATFLDSSGAIVSGNQFNTTNTVPINVANNTAARNKTQIVKLKQYTNVTINAGVTLTVKKWDGDKGGIIGFFANGTFTNNGTITGAGKGFRGGQGFNLGNFPGQGEGSAGWIYAGLTSANYYDAALPNGSGGGSTRPGSGGSGGNGTDGTSGNIDTTFGTGLTIRTRGAAGLASGVQDLSSGTLGGGAAGSNGNNAQSGADGGGMAEIYAYNTVNSSTGIINFNGNDGGGIQGWDDSGASGGAGGSINFKSFTFSNSGTISATGGLGGAKSGGARVNGVAGAPGRVAVTYGSTATGTTSPTAYLTNDPTINNVDGYQIRFHLSSNGTNSETYAQNVTEIIEVDKWYRWAVTWDAPTSTANFYQNAVLIGTQVGAFTQIYNSTARFALATSYNAAGNPENFLNAKMDDTRVWNSVRSQLELAFYNDRVLVGTETNNSAYYKFEGNVNDSQTYTATSNLTATNSPTYSTDVPFAGITTRADQDIEIDAVGSTYALGIALSEAPADRQTFQPTKEPVKSVQLNIDDKGTGDWTVVIHDALNREIASVTVPNAQLSDGYYEFTFAESFRPILTASYHVHVYSTVADGVIVSSSLNDMEGTTGNTGAYFATFYQILVDDIYHPMTQFQNFLVIGNERYVAKLEAGNLFNPHQITLPAGYRVRCFAKWNEYLAIGVWKGNSITDTDQGKVFLWDGSTDTSGTSNVNTIVDVLEGGVNSMQGAAGILYIISGYEGKLSLYGGGATEKATQIPLLKRDEYCETAPGAMTMWRSILRFGSTLNTDSSTVHQGVYGYGRLNAKYPNSLGFDFPLSLGDQTSNSVRIGCVFPAGQSLYTGWQSGNVFGIDRVSVTSDCYETATIEHCIIDGRRMSQKKLPLVWRVDCEPLTEGQSILIYYKADRESSWNLVETEDSVGATEIRAIVKKQVKEIQFKDVYNSTSGVSPVIIQSAFENDDQGETIIA